MATSAWNKLFEDFARKIPPRRRRPAAAGRLAEHRNLAMGPKIDNPTYPRNGNARKEFFYFFFIFYFLIFTSTFQSTSCLDNNYKTI